MIQMSFSPTAAGTSNTTLTVTDNTVGSPHAIPVTGIATQTLAPTVTLFSIDSLGQTVSATLNGMATVGGPNIPAVAWIEYGTDPLLANFSNTQLFATMAAWPEVNLTLASGASNIATISAGQTATYQLVAWDGGNGYTGTASLSCSGAPQGSTCVVTPTTVSIGLNGAPLTVTVTTTGKSSALLRIGLKSPVWATGLLHFGLTIVPRKKLLSLRVLVCLGLLSLSIFGCGGGASGSAPPPPPPPPTPSGAYYLTLSAVAGGAQTSYLLTLNVN